jgi:hypothetical protein
MFGLSMNTISLLVDQRRPASEVAEFLDFPHPLLVRVSAGLDTDHAKAEFALETLVLLFEGGAKPIAADDDFGVAFAAARVRTDTTRAFCNFHEVMILELRVQAVSDAEFAIVHVLVHFAGFATGEAYVVIVALGGCVELVADAQHAVVAAEGVGVEVAHRQALRHRGHLRQHLQPVGFLDRHAAFAPVRVPLVILLYVDRVVAIVETDHVASEHLDLAG